jgi:hypothetical protein
MRLVVLGLLVATLLATAASAATKPRLWVTRSTPITLAGVGFPHGIAVKVTVRAGATQRIRVVRATLTGRISASFALPTFVACRGLVVVATAKAPTIAAVTIRFTPSPGSSRDCAPKQPVDR